jgi:hypothetical protein
LAGIENQLSPGRIVIFLQKEIDELESLPFVIKQVGDKPCGVQLKLSYSVFAKPKAEAIQYLRLFAGLLQLSFLAVVMTHAVKNDNLKYTLRVYMIITNKSISKYFFLKLGNEKKQLIRFNNVNLQYN